MGLMGGTAAGTIAGCLGGTQEGDGSGTTEGDDGGTTNDNSSSSPAATTLNLGGSPTGTLEDWSRLYEETDIENVSFTNVPNDGTAQRILEGGLPDQLSVVLGLSSSEENFGSELLEVDSDRIDRWDNLIGSLSEPVAGNEVSPIHLDDSGKLVGVPAFAQGDSFAYDESVTGELNSYGALFDSEWQGQVALWNSPLSGFVKTPLYLKHNNLADIDQPDNMTREEVTTVADFLIEKKEEGQFLTLWDTYDEAVNLLVSGETPVLDAWFPMVLDAHERGMPSARYATVDEGYAKWTHNAYLLDGEEYHRDGVEDIVYQFLNFITTPFWSAGMLELRAYVGGTTGGKEYVDEHPDEFEDPQLIKDRYDNSIGRMTGPGAWLNKQPDNAEWYEEEWNRFVNA